MRSFLVVLLVASACTKASAQAPAPKPVEKHATAATSSMGAPIAATVPVVALSAIVKDPAAFKGKAFVTTGTVTAVCQEMGCWMEIKDDATEAHIKMAGEKFFVPKTAAGRKARVQGTIVSGTDGDDVECAKAASDQMGKQVAKLQVEATGVELD